MGKPDVTIRVDLDRTKITSKLMHDLLDQAVRKAAHDIEAGAKVAIESGDKSGVVYHLHNPEREHQASAPGEAPATDLGTLVNSIQTIPGPAGSQYAEVVVNAEYGAYLEFGAPRAGILPRPFLTPAVEAVKPKLITAVKKIAEME